jgi:quercetin dioxygenase-like cupin family protein
VFASAGLPALQTFDPECIDWQERAADGSRYAVLYGTREAPSGSFTFAVFLPAGCWDRPHWHSGDAQVFVARGALRLALGRDFEPGRATEYPAGSLLWVRRDVIHYDGAAIDTVVFGIGTCPWATAYAAAT